MKLIDIIKIVIEFWKDAWDNFENTENYRKKNKKAY